jgi:heme/copper-type cytochrome/quinol oxidase subunit 3
MQQPRFTTDLSRLPTHGFGHRAITWWGCVAFFLIEGTGFLLAIAAYLFLMNQEQAWPPPPYPPPDLLPGTLFTIAMLLSEIPNSIAKRAAEHGRLRQLRHMLVVASLFGLLFVGLRAWEFSSLHVLWHENAYGSVLWLLLLLHTTHFVTDWADTLVLTALMHGKHGMEGRRFVDCSENAMYWRFVWLCWLPLYFLIYWLPRLGPS